jgi:hypothetical protein
VPQSTPVIGAGRRGAFLAWDDVFMVASLLGWGLQ